jgi:predicted permease
VVNALVLRPLPLEDPARVMLISVSNPARGFRGSSFSLASYESLRDRNRSFSGIAGFCLDALTLTGGVEPEQLAAARVSPNFFEVLGTQPLIGRGFRAADGEAGAAPAVLISAALWQRRFAGDRAILGRTLPLDQEIYTIIGVMPAEYAFPVPEQDVWITRLMKYGRLQPEQIEQGAGFLNSLARLAPGITVQQADAEVASITRQYRAEHPRAPDADPNAHLDLAPFQDSLTVAIRPTLLLLTAAVGFVLLIACANVAGLMMARATGRAREIAIRAALGASRSQLVRQLLAESLLLAAAGAALGVLLASWGVEWLVKADAGNNLPGFQPIRVDFAVLGFTVLISIFSGVGFGLVPALEASRPNLNGVLRDSGWGTTGGARGHRLRSLLVAGQMGLSIVLLIGAGLLLESFRRVQIVALGFDARHMLTARMVIPPAKYPDGPPRAFSARDRAAAERDSRRDGGRHFAIGTAGSRGALAHTGGRPAFPSDGPAPAGAVEWGQPRLLSHALHPAAARTLFHLGRRRPGAARGHRQRLAGAPFLAGSEPARQAHHLHAIPGAF